MARSFGEDGIRFYPAHAGVPFQDFGVNPACFLPKVTLCLAAWLKAM
jgi:hypothetical protein